MYTQRCTRARRELVALLRASLRYRMATPSRTLRPRSTLAARRLLLPTLGRAHPANSTIPTAIFIYRPFPFTEYKKRKNGRCENKRRRTGCRHWEGQSRLLSMSITLPSSLSFLLSRTTPAWLRIKPISGGLLDEHFFRI